MRRIPVLLLCLVGAAPAYCADWRAHEFTDNWDGASGLQHFLNDECRPSGLDGVQLFAVQKGHGSEFHVHAYCRVDGAASVRYRVEFVAVSPGTVDQIGLDYAAKANTRLGPFYFGKEGASDGLLVVTKE